MPLGWGGKTGGATLSPELVTDEERKDRGRREKKGLAARNLQSASCLKLNRNWERGHGRRGWNNMFGERGGLPPCGASPGPALLSTDQAPTHAFSPAALLGVSPEQRGWPTKTNGYLFLNY